MRNNANSKNKGRKLFRNILIYTVYIIHRKEYVYDGQKTFFPSR